MKPTPQISLNHDSIGTGRRGHRDGRAFPFTNYSYQSAEAIEHSSATAKKGVSELHTFRRVSREFFGAESSREYFIETLFFVWITCVAAWPIGVAIQQLTRWMI
jgi:hypothetical protein